MATAAFWDVFELKTNVFMCLRQDGCDADLARCARVHRTWKDLALNALWFGYPYTNCEGNKTRTRAVALLPAGRRQDYASRVGVLDFTEFGGSFVHAMFDGLKFPILTEITLDNPKDGMPEPTEYFRLRKYLCRSLRNLKLIDKTVHPEQNWMTASFLSAVAQSCPWIEGVLLWSWNAPIVPEDLVRFFRRIRPRDVSLYFGDKVYPYKITTDMLSALSCGGRLESLTLTCPLADRHEYTTEEIRAVDLKSLLVSTSEPFPTLERLDLYIEGRAVVLLPQCFPAATRLRLRVSLSSMSDGPLGLQDHSVLEPIAKMSQLQALEIVGDSEHRDREYGLPARAFIPLGSLTRLRSLDIGTSIFPYCVREEQDTNSGDESSEYSLDDIFTAADVSKMFSDLTLLDHLSLNALEHNGCSTSDLLWYISSFCPQLGSIRFVGRLNLWHMIRPQAAKFDNVRQMTIQDVRPGISTSQAARLIDNFAPQLKTLSFDGEYDRSSEIYGTWVKFRKTYGFFKNGEESRAAELLRKTC